MRARPGELVLIAYGCVDDKRQLAIVIRYTRTKVIVRRWYDDSRRWSAEKSIEPRTVMEYAPESAKSQRARAAAPEVVQ